MNDIQTDLTKVFLFHGLPPEQLERIAHIATSQHVAKGELLFSEGDSALAFYGVLSGKVKIYRMTGAGAELTLHIHETGDLIAEAAIFDLKEYPAYCLALEDTVLIRVPRTEFVGLIYTHPSLALGIMHAYSKRLRQFVRLVADLSLGDVKSRVCTYLLRNAVSDNGQMVCTLNISKREWAALAGTVPETLSRVLRSLKDAKLIEEKAGNIYIHQPGKLRSMIQQ